MKAPWRSSPPTTAPKPPLQAAIPHSTAPQARPSATTRRIGSGSSRGSAEAEGGGDSWRRLRSPDGESGIDFSSPAPTAAGTDVSDGDLTPDPPAEHREPLAVRGSYEVVGRVVGKVVGDPGPDGVVVSQWRRSSPRDVGLRSQRLRASLGSSADVPCSDGPRRRTELFFLLFFLGGRRHRPTGSKSQPRLSRNRHRAVDRPRAAQTRGLE